tara:strand:- start:51 stop:953 length:903 start_codon:yes stop_codon:yes gene_type:complete
MFSPENKIVLIQSHCNTEEKLKFLHDKIVFLKEKGLDVLLFSHIPLPKYIIELTDYFIYDKSNPIMWEERRHSYWQNFKDLKLTNNVPEYGWAVYNQIIKSSQFALSQNYEYYYWMCYDTILNDTVIDSLNTPHPCITYTHKKHDNFISKSTLIFTCFDKVNLTNILPLFSKEEYAQNSHLAAEGYFKSKLEIINGTFSDLEVNDFFHESDNIFNLNTHNNYFKFFMNDTPRYKCYIYDLHKEFILVVNNTSYNITTSQLLDIPNHPKINILGYVLEGVYYDLYPEYKKLSFKQIESLNT